MEKFIHQQNLWYLRKRLAEMSDEAMRQRFLRLLAKEEAKEIHLPKRDDNAAWVENFIFAPLPLAAKIV
jgi:hypothetical protein